ncbi:MAG: hypothetical protein WCP21_24700 [Armatimonadota bacterium]
MKTLTMVFAVALALVLLSTAANADPGINLSVVGSPGDLIVPSADIVRAGRNFATNSFLWSGTSALTVTGVDVSGAVLGWAVTVELNSGGSPLPTGVSLQVLRLTDGTGTAAKFGGAGYIGGGVVVPAGPDSAEFFSYNSPEDVANIGLGYRLVGCNVGNLHATSGPQLIDLLFTVEEF